MRIHQSLLWLKMKCDHGDCRGSIAWVVVVQPQMIHQTQQQSLRWIQKLSEIPGEVQKRKKRKKRRRRRRKLEIQERQKELGIQVERSG